MAHELTSEQEAAVTMLLRASKTIKEIVKFAGLDASLVTQVARQLNLEPATEAQRRGKALYASPPGYTFQEIAQKLGDEGFVSDDGSVMHHLTVASWVRNAGWPWGGAEDGDYAPDRGIGPAARSRFTMRLSKSLDAEINSEKAIAVAAEAAWVVLDSDKTRIVQVAVIRAAAAAGVTDLTAVRKELLARHGEAIRTAKI